ncbi:MAG: SCO family protein, partial [Ilumatobacter sp.]
SAPRRGRLVAIASVAAITLAACGGSSDSTASDDDAGAGSPDATPDDAAPSDSDGSGLSGIVRSPAPAVGGTALPSLTEPGTEVEFRAEPGGIEVVYFGFTNCPDVCPTTLSDLGAALNRLERDEPGITDLIETTMVTVDPGRDLDVLAPYVTSFVSDAVALGTSDEALLMEAAEPFGVSYDVRTLDDGTIEVDHSPFLYAVDDQGELVLTWQFGAAPSDIANDLDILLERESA